VSELVAWLERVSADDDVFLRWEGFPPADPAAVTAAETALGVDFPDDYRDLLLASDGGEFTGPEESMVLEPVGDLVDRNTEERYVEGLPGMVVIAATAGDGVFFYDPGNRYGHGEWALYWVELGDLAADNPTLAGRTVTEAVHRIADGVSFFDEPRVRD
jgi:hypothetical protein